MKGSVQLRAFQVQTESPLQLDTNQGLYDLILGKLITWLCRHFCASVNFFFHSGAVSSVSLMNYYSQIRKISWLVFFHITFLKEKIQSFDHTNYVTVNDKIYQVDNRTWNKNLRMQTFWNEKWSWFKFAHQMLLFDINPRQTWARPPKQSAQCTYDQQRIRLVPHILQPYSSLIAMGSDLGFHCLHTYMDLKEYTDTRLHTE